MLLLPRIDRRPIALFFSAGGWIGALFVILLSLGTRAAAGQQVEVIPPTGEWVVDTADLLSSSEEDALNRKLRAYEDTTSTQIVVVTIGSLDGIAPVDYATALGREWRVGQEGQDNGVVILVSRDDREVFIAPGYGLEGAIPDAIASRIVRNTLIPSFRKGDFYAGLSAATDQLIAAAAGEFEAVARRNPSGDGGGGIPAANIFILLIIAYYVISAVRKGGGGSDGGKRYRRRRGGPPVIIWGGGFGGFGGGGGGGGGGFGGFSGGGGSFGGGGAGGGW